MVVLRNNCIMNGNEQNEEIVTKRNIALRALDVFGELFSLNVIFLICSLPIFTLGASITALYSVSFKIIEKKEGSIFNDFLNAFKKNFKQATLAWIGMLFYCMVLFAQYYLIIKTAGIIGSIYIVVLFMSVIIGALVITLIFPIISRYNNSIRMVIKNSFLLAISNLGACIKVFCLWAGTIMISVIYPVIFLHSWFLWLLIAFAVIGYLSARIVYKVFNKVENKNIEKSND